MAGNAQERKKRIIVIEARTCLGGGKEKKGQEILDNNTSYSVLRANKRAGQSHPPVDRRTG